MGARFNRGVERLSLTTCALILSLSSVAYADTENSFFDSEKGYILPPVDTQGINTITKYVYNNVTNQLEPVYYRLDLAKTEYGSSESSRYFEWSQNEYGDYSFEEVQSPTEGKTTISYGVIL